MSRSFDYVSPFGGRPIVTSRTYREPGGVTTVTETVSTTRRSQPVYESIITPFARTERITAPPSTSYGSSRSPAGAGVVTSTSEYERGADGRPSHFSSTVYKSPYGKTHRFTSYY